MTGNRGRMRASSRIDLETVCETLRYIRSDMAKDPELAEVCQALSEAIVAVGKARTPVERLPTSAEVAGHGEGNVVRLPIMRFEPWRPDR
jgi:hypothetical protein